MTTPSPQPSTRTAFLISLFAAFTAGLCCFSPVLIVLFGLGSTAFAASLADTLYLQYKWVFRITGLLLLSGSFIYWYFQSTQSCSIDKKERLRKKFINLFLLSLFSFILFYTVWLYVVVEVIGVQLGIWKLPVWLGGAQ